MVVFLAHVPDGRRFRTVITGKHHQRVVGDAQFLEGLHQFAHYVIHLEKEIAMGAGFRLSLKLLAGKRGEMDGLHRMIEKQEAWIWRW